MIYVTGDTHGDKDWSKIFLYHRAHKLTKEDYMIICGDFGAIWSANGTDEALLNRYAKLPFTVLFVDGNHENFDKLYEYPVETWHGGYVHKIRDNVLHLMRGNVFTIEDKTFFVMGGGTSIDKEWRLSYEREHNAYKNKKPIKIWWEQEIPTLDEIALAKQNLEQHNHQVDYILTHTHANILMKDFLGFEKENSVLNKFLDDLLFGVDYKHWYCGHFHIDQTCKKYKTIAIKYSW